MENITEASTNNAAQKDKSWEGQLWGIEDLGPYRRIMSIQIEKNWESGRQALMGMMIAEDFPKLNKDPIFSNWRHITSAKQKGRKLILYWIHYYS